MPVNDWIIDDFTPWVDQALRDGMNDLVDGAAMGALASARKQVPNPSKSRGYALGSLMESGYVISKIRDDYDEAIARAESIPGTRITVRNQVQGKFPFKTLFGGSPDKAFAVMDFPLAYAQPIRTGFHHVKAKKFIIGVEYIQGAENAITPRFMAAQRTLIKKIEKMVR